MKRTVIFFLAGAFALSLGLQSCNNEEANKKVIEDSSTSGAESNSDTPETGTIQPVGTETETKQFDPNAAQKAEQMSNVPKTTLKFDNYEHDFGKIKQDTDNRYVFKFTNTGSEPLVIENAKGSCGCTVPEYPKEPIAPGASSEISVLYKPGKQSNQQTKKITITANTDPVQTILTIKADVQEVTPGK